MKNMTLENIAKCCGGTYIGEDEKRQREVSRVLIDSRKAVENCLFIPIRGARTDGHRFIPSVMAQGALACLSEERLDQPSGPYILVDSTPEALGKIAAFYRQSLDVTVVGVTGSVGKTSTKEMIASVLKERYCVHRTAGNFNNEIGLPLTIFDLREEHEVAVLEMGISDFGEMHRLAAIANPDICVITNIGLCHLENLGSRDGILKAKTEVFEHMRGQGTVILNGDDDKLAAIRQVNGKAPMFYGFQTGRQGKDAYAEGIEMLGMEGIRMRLCLSGASREVRIPIPGKHNVSNALAAACAGHALGMDLEEICRGIETAETIGGRSNLIAANGITVIDDCYNANPISMRASLDVLAQAPGRRIAVLGDMGELGKDERELHYDVGAYAAQKDIDILYCAGTLSEEIAKGAREENPACQARHYGTKEEMLPDLLHEGKEGDTILVKASHFMEFSRIVEALCAKFK